MTDAIDFDGAVIKLARQHFYLGERGPGRTLQAAALHLRHSLDSLVYHPTTLTILSPLTPLRPCTLYTYCGRYCRPPLCTYSTD